jgi:glycosyltransferase involved in cell wall biosynthesis
METTKIKVGFIWQGLHTEKRYGHWDDGLYAAMKLVEKSPNFEVHYFDTDMDWSGMDILLYWEAPVTFAGKDRDNYVRVQNSNIPKILLFAGGQVKLEYCGGFDLFLVESEINEKDFAEIGLPWLRAFGVNTVTMKPERQPKIFDAVFPATCASWKRQGLFSRALKEKGVICGRFQETDPIGFLNARDNGTLVFPELPYPAVNALYNASWCCVNTSSEWGGGQRTTLEAMAAGIPVIVMKDSIKNREYVEESGAGLVVEPDELQIRNAIEEIKKWTPEQRAKGRAYVESKWTAKHYADNIIKGINQVLKI